MKSDVRSHRYDAFVQHFSANARRIHAYIYTLLPRWSDADDVFQETSRVLWEKFGDFTLDTDFFVWAREVARYQVLAFRQRQARSRIVFSDEFLEVVAAATAEHSERLEAEQRALTECIEKLKGSQKKLVLLRFSVGSTTKSVAAQLGMSIAAVYKSLNRIQDILLHCVGRTYAERRELP